MAVFFGIAYVVIGFVQLFAISAGIEYGLNLNGFVSMILAFFVTYIPLVGSLIGVYGATHAWEWGLLQSVSLFFWYIPVGLLFAALGAFSNKVR